MKLVFKKLNRNIKAFAKDLKVRIYTAGWMNGRKLIHESKY
jgi:hypothetical protein